MMENTDQSDRRIRDEGDDGADLRATVARAQFMIDNNIMTELEALKYFNLSSAFYRKYKVHPAD